MATTYSFNLGNGFLNSYSTTDATYGSLTHTFTPDAVGNSQAASMTGTGGVSTTTFTDTRSFQSGTPAKQWFLPVSVQRSGITWKSFDVDREANTSAIVTSRDANSTLVTTYNYDALGRIKTITPPGGASPEAPTTIAYADTTHTTVTRTGSDGNGTFQEYVYDGLGRISREIRQMPSGYALRLHKYDKANHPYFVSEWNACASVTPPTGNCLTLSPAGGTTQSSFDPFDRPETITKADGTVTTINRTDGTILKSDTREAVTEVVSGSNATTARRRDVLGRIVSVSEPAVNGVATVTSYLYDVLDKVNCVKQDGTGQGTTTCSNNPSGQYRWFQHDAFGFLRSETTPERGNSAVTYGPYDALGDALTELEPGSLTITRVFDAAGRLQKVTSASLVYVRNCYDGTGVTCIDGITNSSGGNFPKGKVSRRYSYNPASSPAGTLQEDFTYSNTAGRLSGKTLAFGGGLTLSASQGWLYNSLGLVSSRTHPIPPPTGGTFSVDTTYSAGLPTQVKNGASNVATNIGYDPSGGLATWTAANGVVTAVTQDTSLLPRPRQIKTTGAIPTASNLDTGIYAYDGAGNLLSIGADQFTYDGRSRLSTTSYSGTGTESYQYDGYGNMLSKSQTAGTTTNWTFCTTTCTNNQMQAASGYGYDARGNLTTNVNETLTYDGLNRQWRDQSPGGGDWTYIYDGTGQRVAKVTGGAATYTLRDEGNRFVTEFAGPTLGRDNVYLGNLLVASRVWDAGSGTVGWNYYHSDHLGTPRLVTDSSHNVVESPRKYWPFGAGISTNPATMQRTRFAAMEVDREATRYYDHARHHETVVSRFVSPDLIGGAVAEPASWNRYVYAHSNPLRLIDPDGKDVFDAVRFINNTGLGTIAARVNAAIAALKEAGGHTFGIFKEWKTSATKAGAELLLRVGLSTDLETRTAKARLEVNTTVGGRGTYVEASTKVVENGQFLPDGAHVELERGVVVGHENVSTSGEVTRTDSVGPFAIENSVDVPKAEEAIGNMVSASVDAAAAVAAGIENKAFQPCGTGAKPEQPCPR